MYKGQCLEDIWWESYEQGLMTLGKSLHFCFLTYEAELILPCVKDTTGIECQNAANAMWWKHYNYGGFATKSPDHILENTAVLGTQMSRAHICWLHLPPRLQAQDGSCGPCRGRGGKVWSLTAGDLSALKGQGPGLPLSDIRGAGVLKVNRRILRT